MCNKINYVNISNDVKSEKVMEKSDREKILKKIKTVMWNNVGLIRSKESLEKALAELENIYDTLSNFCNVRYLKDLTILCKGITLSALSREESRGVHYREDFPTQSEEFSKHTILENNFKINFRRF
jgi:L-aspartate oxidase